MPTLPGEYLSTCYSTGDRIWNKPCPARNRRRFVHKVQEVAETAGISTGMSKLFIVYVNINIAECT